MKSGIQQQSWGRSVVLAAALALVTGAASAQQAAPPQPWTGTVGAGASVTSGNSDTVTYNVAFDVVHDPKTRNVVKTTGLYLRGKQNKVLTVNRTSLGGRDQYALNSHTFVYGQVDYLRDTFKRIDYLLAPTAGVGAKLIDVKPTQLLVDVGVGGVWERNTGADVKASGALTAGEQLTHQISGTATLKQVSTNLWKTTDFGDSLHTFGVGLATKISERTQFSVDLLDTYKRQPPTAATKKNDVALVMALAVKY